MMKRNDIVYHVLKVTRRTENSLVGSELAD